MTHESHPGREPTRHHEATRLAEMDLPTIASLIESRAEEDWLRDACAWFGMGLQLSKITRMGVYALPDERGEAVPTLLVDVSRVGRGPMVPERAAVVGVYYGAGKRLVLSVWPHPPQKVPSVRGTLLVA